MVHNLVLHTDQVFVLVIHPNDKRIFASGGRDSMVAIWDMDQGTPLTLTTLILTLTPALRNSNVPEVPES